MRNGTLVDLYFLGWILDNDAFAKSERKRLTELIKTQKHLKEKNVSTIDKPGNGNNNGKETREPLMNKVKVEV